MTLDNYFHWKWSFLYYFPFSFNPQMNGIMQSMAENNKSKFFLLIINFTKRANNIWLTLLNEEGSYSFSVYFFLPWKMMGCPWPRQHDFEAWEWGEVSPELTSISILHALLILAGTLSLRISPWASSSMSSGSGSSWAPRRPSSSSWGTSYPPQVCAPPSHSLSVGPPHTHAHIYIYY